jgi:hypothetical protein
MKNLIIIIGSILLGAYIFNMMVGNSEDSIKSISREIMVKTIEIYENTKSTNMEVS